MKNVLVLFSYRSHKTGYIEMLFDRLSAVAKQKNMQLYRGSLKDLQISITNGKMEIIESLTSRPLSSFDAAYFELWYKAPEQALAAALHLERKGLPYLGKELLSVMPLTKVGEMAKMADNDIPLPCTFMSSGKETLRTFKINPPINYPLIVKAADGYGGKNNFLVKNYKELTVVLKDNKSVDFIIQEFIPNDRDYRCIVLGDEVKLVLERKRGDSATSHLNNTSQGAEGTIVPLDSLSPEAIKTVQKAALILGRNQFAGADLIINSETGQHYILEVNQTPQIEIGAAIDTKMSTLLDYIATLTRSA